MKKIIPFTILLVTMVGILIVPLTLPSINESEIVRVLPKDRAIIWKKIRDIENQKAWRNEIAEIKFIDKQKEIWEEKLISGQKITLQTMNIITETEWEIHSVDETDIQSYWKGKFNFISENQTELIFKEVFTLKTYKGKLIYFLFLNVEKINKKYINDLESSFKG